MKKRTRTRPSLATSRPRTSGAGGRGDFFRDWRLRRPLHNTRQSRLSSLHSNAGQDVYKCTVDFRVQTSHRRHMSRYFCIPTGHVSGSNRFHPRAARMSSHSFLLSRIAFCCGRHQPCVCEYRYPRKMEPRGVLTQTTMPEKNRHTEPARQRCLIRVAPPFREPAATAEPFVVGNWRTCYS